jgi:uncharacterized protein
VTRISILAAGAMALALTGCSHAPAVSSTPAVTPSGAAASAASLLAAQHSPFDAAALKAWREHRLATLTSPTGWLTPVGLYWLKEGANSFGRAPGNDYTLDSPSLPARAGAFMLQGGQVRFESQPGSGITVQGQPAVTVRMASDKQEHPIELLAGTLHITLIDRVGHLGIRVRDTVSPERSSFRGLQYFPDRPDWSVAARFETYEPAHRLPIVNILGMEEQMLSPGAIVFERDGRTWRLDTLLEEPGAQQLYLMFSDGTSGRETYGAGRYLYIPLPQAGRVQVDFNRAYNPPCAFTAFATCPLPPPQNQLALRIDAGELAYGHGAAPAH